MRAGLVPSLPSVVRQGWSLVCPVWRGRVGPLVCPVWRGRVGPPVCLVWRGRVGPLSALCGEAGLDPVWGGRVGPPVCPVWRGRVGPPVCPVWRGVCVAHQLYIQSILAIRIRQTGIFRWCAGPRPPQLLAVRARWGRAVIPIS